MVEREMFEHVLWTKDVGGDGVLFRDYTVEDLYQAFKARLMAELVAKGRSTEGVVFARLVAKEG